MSSSYALYSGSNDQVSFGDGGRRRRGFFMSVPLIVVAVVVFVACVVSVGLIAHFVTKASVDGGGSSEQATTPLTPQTTTQQPPQTTTQPPQIDIRLPVDVLPNSYSVLLAPYLYDGNVDDFYFTGSVKIEAYAIVATDVIKLHRHSAMNVTSGYTVKVGDEDITVTSVDYDSQREWDALKLSKRLEIGQNVTIEVTRFRAPLKPDLRGLYLSTYTDGSTTKYIATSQLQAVDARKTFPCFDEPKFKANFEITMIRKDPYNAISNMPSAENETIQCNDWFDGVQGNCTKERFEPTPRMSTYLLAFIVSEFEYVDKFDEKGRLYRNWQRAEFNDIAEYALEAVTNITNYFEGYYNVSYPLNKTDQAAVPDFNAGAMENWGLIIYRESRLLYDASRDTSAIKQAIGSVISHELAHMWFGNLVTPDWWDDIWLNEGFASFTQNLGVDQLHPDWEIDAQFVSTQQRTAFNVDSKGASHPIYLPIKSTTDINSAFDSITYRKGATVLRQLYYFLGDEIFKFAIGRYLTRHSYLNTHHTELHKELTDAAIEKGKDLNVTEVMERWILQMGHPVVNCSRVNEVLTLKQQQFLSDPSQKPNQESPFNYEWIIPITMATSANVSDYTNEVDISDRVVWMKEKEQSFSISGNPDWYLLNLRSSGFYRINYDEENWQKLTAQLKTNHSVFAPHDRARIIEDSFALAGADYISYSIPLEITKYLANEDHFVPWQSAMAQLSYLHTMLHRQSPEYGPFSQYMRNLLKPKFQAMNLSVADPTHLGKQMQNLVVTYACLYGLRECETAASSLFEGFEKSNYSSTFIKPDVRGRVLCEGVVSSFVVQWDSLFKAMKAETHPGIQNDMLRALACSSEPWILNRYLDYAINDSMIRRQDASSVFSSVSANPNGLQIVWDFLREKWNVILERMPSSFTIAYFVANLSRFNTKQKLEELKTFKQANINNLGAAAQQMDLTIEDVNINIRWMESNLEELRDWLNANVEYNPAVNA